MCEAQLGPSGEEALDVESGDLTPAEYVARQINSTRAISVVSAVVPSPAGPGRPADAIETDSYGGTTDAIYKLARRRNVTPSEYDDLVGRFGRWDLTSIREAILRGDF